MEMTDEFQTQAYGQLNTNTQITDLQAIIHSLYKSIRLVKIIIYYDNINIYCIDLQYLIVQNTGQSSLKNFVSDKKNLPQQSQKTEIQFYNDEYIYRFSVKIDNGITQICIVTTCGRKFRVGQSVGGDTFNYYGLYGYYVDILALGISKKLDYLVLTQRKRQYIQHQQYMIAPFENKINQFLHSISKQQIDLYLNKVPSMQYYRSHVYGTSVDNSFVFDDYFDFIKSHQYLSINQIVLYYDNTNNLCGIQAIYYNQQQSDQVFRSQLNYQEVQQCVSLMLDNDEYLIQIEGTYQLNNNITYLCIYTNQSKQIKIGEYNGQFFNIQSPDQYYISGLGGQYTSSRLMNLYTYFSPLVNTNNKLIRSETFISTENCGSLQDFDDYYNILQNLIQNGLQTINVSKIKVYYDDERIFGLSVDYLVDNTQIYSSGLHVGQAIIDLPFVIATIKLNPNEQIQQIYGTYDTFGITSLTIYIHNDKIYTYGNNKNGKQFYSDNKYTIKAFGGAIHDYLQSIWFYYQEDSSDNVSDSQQQINDINIRYSGISEDYVILDNPKNYKKQIIQNPLITRYKTGKYPRAGPFAGFVESCLDFWDDLHEKIQIESPFPIGVKVKVNKIEVDYNSKYVFSLKFHYLIEGINIQGETHGGNQNGTQKLWQTLLTGGQDHKHDVFCLEENEELKCLIVKYDEEHNLNFVKVCTNQINKHKSWPPTGNSGQKFKIYFNCSDNIKFQGFCGGVFGNFIRCIAFIYHAGRPRISQIF